MKKLEKFCRENKVFIALAAVVMICGLLMLFILFRYFYAGNDVSEYGDRTDGIEEVEITSKRMSEIEEVILESEGVTEAELIMSPVKTLYTYITFEGDISLTEAQSKALETLTEYSEEEIAFYDFEFTLIKEDSEESEGFLISGVKTVNGSTIVWNNNYVAPETTEE